MGKGPRLKVSFRLLELKSIDTKGFILELEFNK